VPSPLIPLVGRDVEVAALVRALDAAADGVAGVVALVGDAGAGKSRLVEEGTVLARARGFLTLRAVASLLHGDLPYGVIVEALRPVVRTVEAGARTRLVEGLPDLGRLFDGLELPAPVSLGDPGMERTRLFEAVCRLLDRLTRQQPVLLVVDDLQWADPASLAMLHYVVRGLGDRRFLLLTARRAGDYGGELGVLLSSLRRSDLLTEVDVGTLDATGVAALARGLLADEPPGTLTGLLVERTRGLPLFVRALVTTLIDSRRLFRSGGRWVLGQEPVDDVPAEVVGLLHSRLAAVDPADRAVFDTIAVAGGTVRHDLLSAPGLISGLGSGEAELLGRVKRLRQAGLLVEDLSDDGVRYQVTHPLLAEVAYDDLPAVVRRRTHAAIASALRRLDPADVGRLAHHVRGAGDEVDAGTALDVLVAALDAALDGRAGEEPARHPEAAIGLARRLGREELLPRLQEQRAEALELAGRGDAAIAAWRAAAEDSAAQGRPVDAARQLRRLAIVEWNTGHLARAQTHLDEATAALSGTPMGPEHLALAETRMRVLARRGLVPELRAEIAELERLAAATGSRQALAFAHWGSVDLCMRAGDHRGAERAISMIMQLAREENMVLLLEEAHRPATCNALGWGDIPAARRAVGEARRLARETGVPAAEALEQISLTFVDFLAGAWDDATTCADAALALSHRVGMRRSAAAALCVRALVHTRRGQYTEAATCLREARSVYGEGFAGDLHLVIVGEVCEAMLLLGRGDAQGRPACRPAGRRWWSRRSRVLRNGAGRGAGGRRGRGGRAANRGADRSVRPRGAVPGRGVGVDRRPGGEGRGWAGGRVGRVRTGRRRLRRDRDAVRGGGRPAGLGGGVRCGRPIRR
jgi:tetratricopeptide (TPR) repeat protein